MHEPWMTNDVDDRQATLGPRHTKSGGEFYDACLHVGIRYYYTSIDEERRCVNISSYIFTVRTRLEPDK